MSHAALAERLLDLACRIQQIPAPTFEEHERAAFVRTEFESLGLADVTLDEMGNVIARRPGGAGAPLLVTAHLDTVFPREVRLDLVRTPERIAGPGIGDNSLGVAGLFGLAWALADSALPGDLYLAANVGEEGLGDLRGMRRVMDQLGARVRATIVLEGMAFGHVHHAAIGVRRYRFSVHTEGGHSYLHFGRPSAIHSLVRLAAQLTELPVTESPKSTFNIGTIRGGTSINTIAREAELDLDLRSEDPLALAALAARAGALAGQARAPGVEVIQRVIGDRPSGHLPREHPLVQLAVRAYHAAGVQAVSFEASSTDANLPLSRGLACVCVGLTTGGNSHRPDEYIDIPPVARGLPALVQLVQQAYSLPA